jgi:hypothetical protein
MDNPSVVGEGLFFFFLSNFERLFNLPVPVSAANKRDLGLIIDIGLAINLRIQYDEKIAIITKIKIKEIMKHGR